MMEGNRGRLIVLDGLDGSGKATQAELLTQALSRAGNAVRQVSFPDYASPSSALVRMYLDGEFGERPGDVNAYAASSFYAVDRYASYKRRWEDFYLSGGIVIADRYTTSNAIHQCSKLPEDQWDSFLDWLFHYEYELLGIPAPDLVIYLDVDPEVSQRLMEHRYESGGGKRDIHERDLSYIHASRRAGRYCQQRFGWEHIFCCEHGRIRAEKDIHAEIVGTILNDSDERKKRSGR